MAEEIDRTLQCREYSQKMFYLELRTLAARSPHARNLVVSANRAYSNCNQIYGRSL
jgi:hypothetical protein